ncbi:MAG: DUF3054 domain-containing protein [Georgenia sp.]
METSPEQPAVGSFHPFKWFGLDLAGVLVFAFVGVLSHGSPLGDYLQVVWPFVVALAAAWMVPAVRAFPLLIWPSGVLVWAVTVAIGLGLRWVTGGGGSGAFPVVTAVVLAVLIIGWRVVPEVVERRREHRARYL